MIFAPLAGRAEAMSGRPSRPWISAPSRLVAIGALVLVALVAAVDLPKWVVRLRESVPTPSYCAAGNGFGGGVVALVQVDGEAEYR